MAKRPDISVILFYNRGVVRADFNRGHRGPIFKLQESVDVESTIMEAVEQVVDGQSPIASRALVLWTDVWSQIISLPRLSISGIESEELDEILKFEAETLSGIEIDEVSLASIPLGRQEEMQRFWVSAIRKSDLDSVHRVLESAGCREIVVAHPAGLSGDPKSSSATSIEVWNEIAYFLEEQSSKLVRVKQASIDQFHPDHQILLGIDAASFEIDDEIETRRLADEHCFDEWAAQIARNYLQREHDQTAPLIRLARASSGISVRYLFSGMIALAVIGFCFWHWNYMRVHNESVVKQIVEIKKPAAEKKKYDSQLISILETRAELETEDAALGDDLKRVQFFLDNQSNRIPKLLNLLVELGAPEMAIEKIAGSDEGVSISGISLNGEAAQALAKRLREKAVPLGWAVNPARQEGQQKLTTGGPWNYEILLTDTGPFESAVQPRKKSGPAL